MIFIILIVLIALVFDFTNGMHDAANSIATVVSTKVLSPRQAVIWAAFFNFVAFLIFGTRVAETIGKGLIDIHVVTPKVIFAGLLGAPPGGGGGLSRLVLFVPSNPCPPDLCPGGFCLFGVGREEGKTTH